VCLFQLVQYGVEKYIHEASWLFLSMNKLGQSPRVSLKLLVLHIAILVKSIHVKYIALFI